METSQQPESPPSLNRVWYVTLAHTAIDFYMVLTYPLWAFFKTRFGLTIFQVSFLPAAISVFGSFAQPFLGYFGDRRNRMALISLGVLVCGLFVSSIGFAPSALVLALLLVAASFGSSLFHPNAGGLVTALAPHRVNFALAAFLTGGTIGMSLAPIAGTQIIERWGLENLWVVVFPSLIISGSLFSLSRKQTHPERTLPPGRIDLKFLRRPAMRPLWTLYAISVLRSLIHSGFVSFTSHLGSEWGWSTQKIGWVLSSYLLCSSCGRIVGGYFGDRVSPRKLLVFSNFSSAFFHLGYCFGPFMANIPLFLAGGFLFDLAVTTNIILAQRILPQNTSTATGLMMGFSWGAAGLMIPLIGILAEATSVAVALAIISTFLIPAGFLVSFLPSQPAAEASDPPAARA